MPLYGLIGYPLSHSFSGAYFTEKFRQLGLDDHRYELFPIPAIDEVRSLLQRPGLKGLNVTIPYKQQVLAYLDDKSGIPEGLNACNCIHIRDGRTHGFNTDVTGFDISLSEHLSPVHNKALILGNGGATEAVKYVLKKKNIAFSVVSRVLREGSHLTYNDLSPAVIAHHRLIINTTPLGMYPDVGSCPGIPYEGIGPDHYLFDLTYNPERTLFLQKGAERGATIKNGADMLVIQAEESWKIWNGAI